MTALQRLLRYPHSAVFDTRAHGVEALRLHHPEGLSWSVADEWLHITAGDRVRSYELGDYTLRSLADAVAENGVSVAYLSNDMEGLSASVLVEGSGDLAASNGNALHAFTNPLWSLMGGYAREVRELRTQVANAIDQMDLRKAGGEWLNLWGRLFNWGRGSANDEAYREAIPREVFRIRLNPIAIEQAILDQTGKDVTIEEPWGEMFRLDEGALSGTKRLYNGGDVGYHLIRPVSNKTIAWDDVLAVIERNRPAGVIVLGPEARVSSMIDASSTRILSSAISSLHSAKLSVLTHNRLDYMTLSGEVITRNYKVGISQLLSLTTTGAIKLWDRKLSWGDFTWVDGTLNGLPNPKSISTYRQFNKAETILSDGPALGDQSSMFPRYEVLAVDEPMTLSGAARLSGIEHKVLHAPVDEVSTSTHSFSPMPYDGYGGPGSIKATDANGYFVQAIATGVIGYKAVDGRTWEEAAVWGDFPWNELPE